MNKHEVLAEGERLLEELARREAERAALRQGQRCVHWIERGVEYSRWEWIGSRNR